MTFIVVTEIFTHRCSVAKRGGCFQRRLFVMVAVCNRADHYIFALWFLPFFPRLISVVADWMSAVLPHMVWL